MVYSYLLLIYFSRLPEQAYTYDDVKLRDDKKIARSGKNLWFSCCGSSSVVPRIRLDRINSHCSVGFGWFQFLRMTAGSVPKDQQLGNG